MKSQSKDSMALAASVLQTVVLMIAIGAMMLEMGRKDHMLDSTVKAVSELRDITQDLAKTQVSLTVFNDTIRHSIADLDERLQHLERGR